MYVKPVAGAEAICHYHHCAYVVLHLCSCDHWIVLALIPVCRCIVRTIFASLI